MLRKFNNYPAGDEPLPHSRWRKFRRVITAIVILLMTITGYAIFTFHDPLILEYTRISQNLREELLSFLERKGKSHPFFQAVKDIIPGPGTSSTSADTSAAEKSVEEFLYTVELMDGGRIEGRTLKIGKETITVTEDSGVEVKVAKTGVSRISKRSLP
jgi:hypothetical protein